MNPRHRRYFAEIGFPIEISSYSKVYRCSRNIEFLESCLHHRKTPKFAIIGKSAAKNFTSKELEDAQRKRAEKQENIFK